MVLMIISHSLIERPLHLVNLKMTFNPLLLLYHMKRICLILVENILFSDNTTKESTSKQPKFDESDVENPNPSMNYLDLDSFRDFPIGLTSLITRDNSSNINNLKASTFLSPMHCDLIDQSIKNQRPKLPSFKNDYEITWDMNSIKPWYLPLVNQQFNMKKKYIK